MEPFDKSFADLSYSDTIDLIHRVNEVLTNEFELSDSSINAFWGTVQTGVELASRA